MLYLGIDQHRKQLTVNIRQENGDVLLKRQVSTEWDRVRQFFDDLSEQARAEGGFVAVVEVCGFNHWLMKMLDEYGCREAVLIQPDQRSRKKTDRRDAAELSKTLWVNRERLIAGKNVHGVKRIVPPTPDEEADRQLTAFRDRTGKLCTRVINKVHRILLKHNLQQECPTKGIKTKKARRWFRELDLDEIDRFEMDLLLDQWDLIESQLARLDTKIRERQARSETAMIIATIPGGGAFSSLTLASRIGDIERFPRADSLANYWGLVPSCRNSGDVTDRLGSITKQGSKMARFILAQMVLQLLRRDSAMKAWYARIKKRRGSKIARVAVMRRLATILWHMIKQKQAYVIGGAGNVRKMKELYEISR